MKSVEKGQISIHTENIFPIIKKSLYSEHEIFLRELISNGVDAIQKLKMVSYAGELSGSLEDPVITLTLDKDKKTLTITDNGIGMTAEEIKKYINQVAFSSAEDFIDKYKGGADQPIIGHFGLGFIPLLLWQKRLRLIRFPIRKDLNLLIGVVMVHPNLNCPIRIEPSGVLVLFYI